VCVLACSLGSVYNYPGVHNALMRNYAMSLLFSPPPCALSRTPSSTRSLMTSVDRRTIPSTELRRGPCNFLLCVRADSAYSGDGHSRRGAWTRSPALRLVSIHSGHQRSSGKNVVSVCIHFERCDTVATGGSTAGFSSSGSAPGDPLSFLSLLLVIQGRAKTYWS